MSWHPPWSFEDRGQWARARPWLAGFYFGLGMALLVGVYLTVRGSVVAGMAVGAAAFLWCFPLFGLGIKHRWGLRPDTEEKPPATLVRPWTAASDRWLSWFMWLFAFGAVVLVIGFAARRGGTLFGDVVPLGLDVLLLWTIWTERRRRRDKP